MISLICGISKIQQTNEFNKKEADSDIESKSVVTSASREGRGLHRGRAVGDTDYWV